MVLAPLLLLVIPITTTTTSLLVVVVILRVVDVAVVVVRLTLVPLLACIAGLTVPVLTMALTATIPLKVTKPLQLLPI